MRHAESHSPLQPKKVIVVGAGVVGCSTALALAGRGWEVAIVDSQAGPGHGTSRANGAQLSYSYVKPLATPATLAKLPSLLFSPDSPLTLRLRADVHQWTWLAQFAMACNTQRVQQSTRELLKLAQLSRRALDDWMEAGGWNCEYAMPGKLVLASTQEALAGMRAQVDFQALLGSQQSLLPAGECVAIEPALAGYEPSFAGGVWTADECVVNPLLLTDAITQWLQREGHVCHFNRPVHSLAVHQGRVVGVNTAAGEMLADSVVVCSGIQVNQLLAGLAPRLPIYPIKGYSVTLDMVEPTAGPTVSITDSQRKLVFARLGNRVRVAGRAELVGYETDIPPRAIEELLQGMCAVFPAATWTGDIQPWAGLRPATPTGLPIYGPTPTPGLYVNAGHGALGLTLAAGSATALAAAMSGAAVPA
jgi:D-amino-acid dehydrogenase